MTPSEEDLYIARDRALQDVAREVTEHARAIEMLSVRVQMLSEASELAEVTELAAINHLRFRLC